MRIAFFALVLAMLAISTFAVKLPQKAIIVSYPDETPDSVVSEAMAAIKAAGGKITHEYKLIKGFAAKASEKAIESLETMSQQYHALVEDDQTISITNPTV